MCNLFSQEREIFLEEFDATLNVSHERRSRLRLSGEERKVGFVGSNLRLLIIICTLETLALVAALCNYTTSEVVDATTSSLFMQSRVEGVARLAIGAIDFFLLFERHVAHFVPFGLESFDRIVELFAAFGNELFQTSDDVLLLSQVYHFFFVTDGISRLFAIEESIASSVETLPDGITRLVRHRTDGLPFGLQLHKRLGGSRPVSALAQLFRLFAEGSLLCQVGSEGFAHFLVELRLSGEEEVASGTEAVEDLLVGLARCIAHGLPLGLECHDFLRLCFPIVHGVESRQINRLHTFAECSLAEEVVFFLLLLGKEEILVTLVDDGRSRLETIPHLIAQFLSYRTGFAELSVQLLQLVEGANHIFLLGELLSGFADARFNLQVLLEVIFAHLMIDAQEVVALLHIVVVVFPSVGDVFGRDGANFLPLGLECFESIVVFVDLLSVCGKTFDLLDDSELSRQICLAFSFSLFSHFCTAHLDICQELLVFSF